MVIVGAPTGMSELHGRQTMVESTNRNNLQNHRSIPSIDTGPPPVPEKDHRVSGSFTSGNEENYFRPGSLSRTSSTFSFSRASFSSQLSSLTSMTMPRAESLAASIKAIPTASRAVRSLDAAAQQIQSWTQKAAKVLKGLDADDDIEWAQAAGRDGLEETDKCVTKFEHLVLVYVEAIEELQLRPDIGNVGAEGLQTVVEQMESTLSGWEKVRKHLKDVRDQVELAMEWEELWGVVLGDVGNEMEELSSLIFEMEEKRHKTLYMESQGQVSPNLDLNELEHIVDENPARSQVANSNRFSLPPAFAASPAVGSPVVESGHDDSNLLALFARMQPLRASLDFLPMRLSMFSARAGEMFPTACNELEHKRSKLEAGWKQLAKEAEDLRRELGEDRWILVFRNAGRQAQKMCESVERSIAKLQEGIEVGLQQNNPSAFANRVEGFQAKKMHYAPAIDRVLLIIHKGLKDRLTVNGEILRLQCDMSSRAQNLNASIRAMEDALEDMNANQNSQLRDSISTVMSLDRSISGTTATDTPGSSPASSVITPASKTDRSLMSASNSRRNSARAPSHPPISSQNKRYASTSQPRRPITPSTLPRRVVSPAPSITSVYRQGVYTPPTAPLPARPSPTPLSNKPRWSSSGNASDLRGNYTNKPSSSSNNQSYRRPSSRLSTNHFSSPLSRETSASPPVDSKGPVLRKRASQQLASFADRVGSPSLPRAGDNRLLDPVPYHRGRNITSPVPGTIRSPSSAAVHNHSRPTMTAGYPGRPSSSLNQVRSPISHLPSRTSLDLPRFSPKTEDSGIDIHSDFEDEEDLDTDTALASSPLTRPTTASRPGSVMRMTTSMKGKRASLLPVPASTKITSGRSSVMGDRPWR